jgi:hypothetical protein
LALILGKDGFSKDYWVADCFAAPEVSQRKGSDFAADIWYLALTMYSIVHPKGYCPWMSGQLMNGATESASCGIAMQLKVN